MDGHRFDDLTRRFASRRGVLRGIAGSAVAVVLGAAGVGRAAAQTCRPAGRTCNGDALCCSRICGPRDATGRRRCICPPGTVICDGDCVNADTAFDSDPDNCGSCGRRCPHTRCALAVCTSGVCGLAPNPNALGQSCDDGNACTTESVCEADGSCVGLAVDCSSLNDECHAGVCNPAAGRCEAQVTVGASCNDDDPCTADDRCREDGTCGGGTAIADGTACDGGMCCSGVCRECCDDGDCVEGVCESNACLCSPFGGRCAGQADCCGVGNLYVFCSSGGACGGPGAFCGVNETCVSGVCSSNACQ